MNHNKTAASLNDLVEALNDGIAFYDHAAAETNDQAHRQLYLDLLVNVMGIAVLADAQGRGAGRALMEHVEGWARERGASGLRLVSGEARAGAHAFYERLGFVTTKKQLNYRKPL